MFGREKNININITTETLVKAVLVIVLSVFLLNFFRYIASPLKLIVISAFLAIALNPAVSWFARRLKNRSRMAATAIAYIIILFLIVGFVILVVPPLVNQSRDFIKSLPTSVSDIQNQDTAIVHFIRDRGLTEEYSDLVNTIKNDLLSSGGTAINTAKSISNAVVGVIVVIVMTFMMLVEGPKFVENFWEMQPRSKLAHRKRVAGRMYGMFTGYVNGQLLIASIAGIFALIALLIASTVFNVEINVVALALIVTLIGLIPLIGNTLAAIIVVIVCLFVSFPLAITMGVFFLLYQQIENATLQPYIQSKYNELTPLTVFIAALIGVSLAGFIGALIAIPIAGCIRVYLVEYHGDKIKEYAKKNSKA